MGVLTLLEKEKIYNKLLITVSNVDVISIGSQRMFRTLGRIISSVMLLRRNPNA